ncbi:MAG: hypothetical protein MUO75_05425, partial [Actinobacteria bacterium]|nr:hypothetical protein [Actinomycetota bacterium]
MSAAPDARAAALALFSPCLFAAFFDLRIASSPRISRAAGRIGRPDSIRSESVGGGPILNLYNIGDGDAHSVEVKVSGGSGPIAAFSKNFDGIKAHRDETL